MTLDHIEKQAQSLLRDVVRLRAGAACGESADPELLRQMRVTADGIKNATFALAHDRQAKNQFPEWP
jgi:hypothetical protein